MEIAKVFENGRSQAVRLPKKYRFTSDEVVVQRLGASLILTPKDKIWESFMNGINGFTEDFFEDGRYGNTPPAERDSL
ncbi:MAG: type II toxin-antitoxin system VapB family antitoxin [Acetatifactor sp.]|nr:type II toxin-antitoxin system VapB family antitoxin [Acetatifactor sp.]